MLKILLIVFAIVLTSCRSTAPKPPSIAYCPIVAIEGGAPYLYCTLKDGSKHRIPIEELPGRQEKYICTTDQGYADAYKYGKRLERWIGKNCGG